MWRRRKLGRSEGTKRALDAIFERELVFIHIPKCGGKTVISELYGLGIHEYFGHATVDFYKAALGPRAFGRFTKFAAVREPVARTYSAFRFGQNGGFGIGQDNELKDRLAGMSWTGFLESGRLRDYARDYLIFSPQLSFITGADGRIACDVLLRTERLSADLGLLTGGGIDANRVSRVNASAHDEPLPPLKQEHVDAVREVYGRDFDLHAGKLVPCMEDGPGAVPQGAG